MEQTPFNPRKRYFADPIKVDTDTTYATLAQMRVLETHDIGTIARNVAALSVDTGMPMPVRVDASKMVPKCLKVLAERDASLLKARRAEINREIRMLTRK